VRQRSNTFLLFIALVSALSLLTAAVAMAATIIGNDGPNNLTGTDQRDRIFAKGGDDTVNALARADRVIAGDGNDIVNAGAGHDGVPAARATTR
jgi:Ca2+-binding RTX toxin-like protein